MKWLFPPDTNNKWFKVPGIPVKDHPGAFGFRRRNYFHTGVDLYCGQNHKIYAAETGTIVRIGIFTGPKLNHSWWNETQAVMIEGESGVINYGEISPLKDLKVGKKVYSGEFIGKVSPVLQTARLDVLGHSRYMLHLELYKHGFTEFLDVKLEESLENSPFIDPTPYLINAFESPGVLNG